MSCNMSLYLSRRWEHGLALTPDNPGASLRWHLQWAPPLQYRCSQAAECSRMPATYFYTFSPAMNFPLCLKVSMGKVLMQGIASS